MRLHCGCQTAEVGVANCSPHNRCMNGGMSSTCNVWFGDIVVVANNCLWTYGVALNDSQPTDTGVCLAHVAAGGCWCCNCSSPQRDHSSVMPWHPRCRHDCTACLCIRMVAFSRLISGPWVFFGDQLQMWCVIRFWVRLSVWLSVVFNDFHWFSLVFAGFRCRFRCFQ